MAKRKKGRRSRGRRGKKRSAPKSDRAFPMGAGVGTGLTTAKVMTDNLGGTTDFIDNLKLGNFSFALTKLEGAIVKTDNLKPVVAGIVISAAPKIPLLRMLAKPVDKAVRRMSKGKVSL